MHIFRIEDAEGRGPFSRRKKRARFEGERWAFPEPHMIFEWFGERDWHRLAGYSMARYEIDPHDIRWSNSKRQVSFSMSAATLLERIPIGDRLNLRAVLAHK